MKCALFVRLEAKPGKEQAIADFLAGGLKLTSREATTPIWFALNLLPVTFGVFEAFAYEEGRRARLKGDMAEALIAQATELLATPPSAERIDVLAMKNKLA